VPEVIALRGRSALSSFRIAKLLAALSAIRPGHSIRALTARYWHFVEVDRPLDAREHTTLLRLLTYGPVDAGDSEAASSGRISWINPVGPHRELPGAQLTPTSFNCTPRTGLLAIFPGWLRHAVEPYQGTRPRIAVAANIEVQRLRP